MDQIQLEKFQKFILKTDGQFTLQNILKSIFKIF